MHVAIIKINIVGTHDVLDTEIEPNSEGTDIHVQYVANTRAVGSLLLFIPFSNRQVDFSRSAYLPLDKNLRDYTLPSQLPPESYIISSYDIEENGTLQNGVVYPAVGNTFFINEIVQSLYKHCYYNYNILYFNAGSFSLLISNSPDIENCNITAVGHLVSILCNYSTNSLAANFQVIVQKNVLNVVSRLYVNQTQPGQANQPVTVQVDGDGVYWVTVLPTDGERGIVGSAVAYSVQLEVSNSTGAL